MKKTIIFILILELLISTFSLIPNWDLKKSAINLLTSSNNYIDTFEVNRKNYANLEVVLNRIITKKDTNSSPTIENIIYFDFKDGIKVDWENIESVYRLHERVYICPTGKHHMQLYEKNNNGFKDIKPAELQLDDWELKCYYNSDYDFMFISYLNAHNSLFVYKVEEEKWPNLKLDIHQ